MEMNWNRGSRHGHERQTPVRFRRFSLIQRTRRILGVAALTLQNLANASAQDSTIRAVQNIFDPLSAPAEILYRISLLVLATCAIIFLVVAGLLTYAIIRYRRKGGADDLEEPPQVYGSAAIELAWTVPPILIVVVLVLVTARTIGEIQKPKPADDQSVEEGKRQFIANSCGACHDIGGTNAKGVFGPDLTHFASRQTLGSGVAANNEENLRSWLQDPQVLKPGCLMPNMKLGDKQLQSILAYLRTLK